ncbi:MAG: winged helix-turn-helix transcriptional regulator [Lachnospiraceae bacterium]|nr:winged helix-turn-helix transcriptional regulator [Lachnospiraceae bacterium]
MLGRAILSVYEKLRIHFYMQIFSRFEHREATLTMVEAFSMECIMALNKPTVAQFAKMMDISAPNAAYRVNSLIKKGYIKKVRSKEDQRIFHLVPSDKYMDYYMINNEYLMKIVHRCKERFSPEDYQKLTEMLEVISNELMPELDLNQYKN